MEEEEETTTTTTNNDTENDDDRRRRRCSHNSSSSSSLLLSWWSSTKPLIIEENDFGEQDDDDFDPSEHFKHFAASVAILAGTAVGSGCSHTESNRPSRGDTVVVGDDRRVGVFVLQRAVIVDSVFFTSRKMKRKDVPLHAVAEQVSEVYE